MTVSTKKIMPVSTLLYAAAIMTFALIHVAGAAITKANNVTPLNNGGSWTGGTQPSPTDIAQWNSASGPSGNTVSIGGDVSWLGAQIANPSGWVTITAGPGTLFLGSSGIDVNITAGGLGLTLYCPVTLNANQTWSVNTNNELDPLGVISGTASLTKTGNGTMKMVGGNTYSGQTTVSGGILVFTGKGSVYNYGANAGSIIINNGATVRLDTSDVLGNHTSIAAATVTINAGGTMASNLTFTTLNNLTLSGGTLLSNGGHDATYGSFSLKGTVTANGTTLSNISNGAVTTNNQIFIGNNLPGGTTTFNVADNVTGNDLVISSVLTDGQSATFTAVASGLIKTGAGTMVLSGNNTYSGTITVNAGTLSLTGTPSSNALKYVINSGGTISVADRSNLSVAPAGFTADFMTINGGTLSTASAYSNPVTANYGVNRGFILGASGGTIEIPNTYNSNIVAILGVIAGSGAMTKTGMSTLNLQGANTYSGNTTISAGTLQLGAANVIPNGAGKGDVTVTSTLDLNTFSDTINGLSGAGTVTSGAAGTPTLTVGNNNVTSTFSGVIQNGSGTLALTKAGSGTLSLSGANTYTGVTTISAGTFQIGAGGTTGAISNSSNVTNNATLIFNLSNAYAYSGVISGSGTVTKLGTGATTLSGTNTYSGGTNLNAGTLNVNSTTALGATASRLTIAGGTTINNSTAGSITLANNNTQTWNGDFTFTGTQALNMGTGAVTLGATSQITVSASTFTEGGAISGSYGLTKTGGGTLVLSGTSNAYTGITTINSGTLQLGANEVIPNVSAVSLVNAAATIFDVNGKTETVGSISGGGTTGGNILLGAGALTCGGDNSSTTFAGIISGTGNLTKTGTGTLTLSGSNTYGGATTLSTGTLLFTNTNTGTGTITCNGGTLGGPGAVGGAVIVNTGATISPGVAGIGTFTINNNLTLATGSNYAVDLGDSTCDKINVFGSVTLGGTLVLNLTKAPLAGRSFDILDNDQSEAISGTFAGIPEGGTITAVFGTTTYTFTVTYKGGTNNNDIVCTPAVAPSITTQPTPPSKAVLVNDSATFSIAATGTLPLTYSWMQYGKSGTTTPVGTNSPILTLKQIPATYDSSTYKCQVKNVIDSVWSNACTLYVITSISSFSYSKPYFAGVINKPFVPADTPKISGYVTKYSISPPLPAGMKIDTTTGIIGGTPTVQADSAAYVVAASNGSGGYLTAPVSIKVFAPAKVAASPISQTAAVNGTVKFFVVASGSKPYSYAWMSSQVGSIGLNSDTLTLANIDTTYNNARYTCIVQNNFNSIAYFDTSKACTLHVTLSPKITQQPASQTVAKGSQVIFSVVAGGGTPPFTYAWIRNGTDTAGTGSSLALASVAASSDKSVYWCVVRNPSGTATSASCTLHVVSAAFGGSPKTGVDSLTVSFVDSSTGGVLLWQWDFGDSGVATKQNPTHKYTAPGTYAVKLKVLAGTVMDSLVKQNFITVSYSKPKAMFTGAPLAAKDSITVHFSDTTKGVETGRQWTFGDTTGPDTSKNPVHTYTQPGSYTVTLVVKGLGGADTLIQEAYVYVYSKFDNPVLMTGRRLSTTKVELTLSNYDSVPTSKTTAIAPWSDSLGLYFRKGSLPSSTQTDTMLQTINITALQGAVKPFKDTVTVPLSAPSDSVFYGFGTALNWNDGTKSVLQGGNGTLVFMKDTVRPSNNLAISGRYLGVDTAAVYLDNVSYQLIDTGNVDSVAVWYGLRDSVNFSDPHTKWFPVSALINGAVASRYTYKINDARFNSDTVRVYVAVEVMGKNLMTSAEKDTSFMAGRIRPANPVKLKAKATSSSTIQLTWNKISGYDRIRIWKGLTAVPPGPDNIPAAQYDTLIPAVTDTTILSTPLLEKHWYYFGAQVLQNGLWSKVTDSASAKDSTPAAVDTSTIANTVKILKFNFDTTRNALVVSWYVNMLDTNIKVGIEYSLNNYPVDPASPPTQIITVKSKTDSAVVKLNSLVAFNTTYYVSMWMEKNGKWALPTDSSERKTTTPMVSSWQAVTYFHTPHDTVLAFGGRVRLINQNVLDTIPTADTLRIFRPSAGSLNGLVPVSIGFTFTEKLASYPMYVGLKVDSLLIPKGHTINDVRIYRQDSAGVFLVEYGTIIDSANWTVSVLTKDLDYPFIAMVDTMAPVVRILSSTTKAVAAGTAVYDTLEITDNIGNDSWIFRFAKGGSAYSPGDTLSGTMRTMKDTVCVKIPDLFVSNSAGVRAIFVAGDAVQFDTADVSRQVIRDSTANTISTLEKKWTPLWVTTRLDTSAAKLVLKDLGDKNGWTYDNTKFRLFRWLSFDANANSPDNKWVEYADSVGWIFDFRPGSLFWIKTKAPTVLHLGSGVTPPLTAPTKIVLAPGELSDVALPFDFSMHIGDIIESTDSDSEKARGRGDSLQYYTFVLDNTKRYRLEPLYVGDWAKTAPEHMNKADSLSGGFCIYNPFSAPVTLSIPPIPSAMSKQKPGVAKKKGQTSEGWSVRVVGQTAEGGLLSTVYCGQSEGKTALAKFYPAMPSIEGEAIRVCDDKLRQWGHEMAQGACAKDGGVTYILAFNGRSNTTEEITYHVENIEALPRGFKAVIMVPGSDVLADPAAQLSVSVGDASGSSFRKLVIGNESYIAKVKAANAFYRLALVGVSPNPFGRMLRIRYSLPYDGIGRVEFSMIDLRGRLVWAGQGSSGPGLRELVWNGASAGKRPVASGMYVLWMKALDTKGKTAGTFEKRVTYLP